MKTYVYCLITFLLMTSVVSSHELTGRVTDASGNSIKDSKIYLSFTYRENPHSFFDFVSDSSVYASTIPIRSNYFFWFSLPESSIVNIKILNKKSALIRTILDNKILNSKNFINRLTDDRHLMKDDIYTYKIDAAFLHDTTKLSGSKELLLLSGLSMNILFNKDYPLQSWATTDSSGSFTIPTEDLPIGTKIYLENSSGIYDSSVVDSLVGIAVVKSDTVHYDSLRIGGGNNHIEMILDQRTAVNASEHTNTFPHHYFLYQNYPNPFNPMTSIRFQIPQAADISLKIYNILGQDVKTLLNKKMQAGSYEVQWDGTDRSGNPVASGIYIYRMETSTGYSQSRKLIFMK